ncbi:MAG: phage holin family protein [Actinobacteria bacterium]|nr:phage holin family protein [Actinomycetota bacterium]
MPADDLRETSLADAVTQVSERASLLVREEIELAKAEMTAKARKLATGSIVGIVAGVFFLTAIFFLLESAAWGAYLIFGGTSYWAGFLIVAGVLILLGTLAGGLAYRALRKGTPPAPTMAIDEARKIRETVTATEATP